MRRQRLRADGPRRLVAALTRAVDLNADLGEEVTDDAGLLAVVTSANVACGYHAGTAGRVSRDVPYVVLRDQVADQVGSLGAIAAAGLPGRGPG